ncbi:MAG: DUF4325 domain-containing protein [Pseudomonadota bacterium]
MNTIIIISKEFKDDYTTRKAGEKLRQIIIASPGPVTLDFKDLKIASSSFFDEGLAKLSENEWDTKKFHEKIKILNLFKMDYFLLKDACQMRGLKIQNDLGD